MAQILHAPHFPRRGATSGQLLYQEIRRCIDGLRGRRIINGTKWIYKTMQDLADRFSSESETSSGISNAWSTWAGSNVSGWMQRRTGTRPMWYSYMGNGSYGGFTCGQVLSGSPSGKVAALRKRQSGRFFLFSR